MKQLTSKALITALGLILLCKPTVVAAEMITDSKPLGGMSYALESYYDSLLDEQGRVKKNQILIALTEEIPEKTEEKIEKKVENETQQEQKFSEQELSILYQIVEAEAGSNSDFCKRNVTHVILNRVESEIFPHSIEAVVFQHSGGVYQFSPVMDGGRYWTQSVSEETKKSVRKALQEQEEYNAQDALFFKMISTGSSYFSNELQYLFEDEEHNYWAHR